jgi:hypothetical protein
MQILTIYMVLGGISHWPGVVYKAVGRPDMLNILSFVKLALLVPTLWWAAVNYGIIGVAWGQLIIRTIGVLIDMWAASKFIKVTVLQNLKVLWPPLLASALMAVAVQVLITYARNPTSIVTLALAILCGATLYASLIWLLDPKSVNALTSLAYSMVRRRSAVSET